LLVLNDKFQADKAGASTRSPPPPLFMKEYRFVQMWSFLSLGGGRKIIAATPVPDMNKNLLQFARILFLGNFFIEV
jgi:hypothetical protein